ncbi:hypothetical protein PIB30_003567 [Stylosanthes scabra]|uniref:Uncharacterized protein n=1 Tax=Stylosanthes scabra TaxID=79078 RepID=A0ABU6X0V4_9FABA|nr:hypothetical protein [Stylosanthes scabra]
MVAKEDIMEEDNVSEGREGDGGRGRRGQVPIVASRTTTAGQRTGHGVGLKSGAAADPVSRLVASGEITPICNFAGDYTRQGLSRFSTVRTTTPGADSEWASHWSCSRPGAPYLRVRQFHPLLSSSVARRLTNDLTSMGKRAYVVPSQGRR